MKAKPLPSQETLLDLFDYEPLSGLLIRKTTNKPVGSPVRDGALKVSIQGRNCYVSRIIWKWVTGEDPISHEIDHIDRHKDNNRWNNLRMTTRLANSLNRDMVKPWLSTSVGINNIQPSFL